MQLDVAATTTSSGSAIESLRADDVRRLNDLDDADDAM